MVHTLATHTNSLVERAPDLSRTSVEGRLRKLDRNSGHSPSPYLRVEVNWRLDFTVYVGRRISRGVGRSILAWQGYSCSFCVHQQCRSLSSSTHRRLREESGHNQGRLPRAQDIMFDRMSSTGGWCMHHPVVCRPAREPKHTCLPNTLGLMNAETARVTLPRQEPPPNTPRNPLPHAHGEVKTPIHHTAQVRRGGAAAVSVKHAQPPFSTCPREVGSSLNKTVSVPRQGVNHTAHRGVIINGLALVIP